MTCPTWVELPEGTFAMVAGLVLDQLGQRPGRR